MTHRRSAIEAAQSDLTSHLALASEFAAVASQAAALGDADTVSRLARQASEHMHASWRALVQLREQIDGQKRRRP
jgi:hypothetical protein